MKVRRERNKNPARIARIRIHRGILPDEGRSCARTYGNIHCSVH